ncbi:hypothetical protein CR513_23189, partial [Mucuna pruriens]
MELLKENTTMFNWSYFTCSCCTTFKFWAHAFSTNEYLINRVTDIFPSLCHTLPQAEPSILSPPHPELITYNLLISRYSNPNLHHFKSCFLRQFTISPFPASQLPPLVNKSQFCCHLTDILLAINRCFGLKKTVMALSTSIRPNLGPKVFIKKSNTLVTASHGVVPISVHSWIIDSGATHHMTSCSKMFSSYNSRVGNKKVKISNGSLSTIDEIGTIKLIPLIILHNVLHVPNLSCNQLSISKITSNHQCQVNFYPSYCVSGVGRMIGSAKERDGLYYFDDELDLSKQCPNTCLNSTFDALRTPKWKEAALRK